MVSRPLVHSTTYACDTASGAMTNISYSDGTPFVSFAYDRLGRQTAITDATGTRTFAYNDALQLAAETNAFGVLVRAYDGLGRTAGFSLFHSANPVNPVQSISYGYDPLGRFQSVSSSVFSVSSVVNYSYLPDTDLLSGWSSPTGHAVTRAFEPHRDLLTAVSNRYNDATVSAFDYINDAIARRTQRIDSGRAGPPDPPVTNRFGYNPRSELTSAAMGTNAYGYAYDPIGNRTAATNNAETLTYLSNALNQYTNILCAPAPLREEIPVYDLDGNLTNYNGWTFAWSGENRLIQASNAVHLVSYVYDYQGRMIHKVVDDQINSLIWDGFTIIQSLTHSQTHTLTNSFIWGLDLSGSLQGFGGVGGLLAEVHDGTPYFAAFDANGNVTEYVSTNGTLVAHYEYSPFGEIVVQSGDMADAFTHRFSTKPWCSVTSLSEYEFRMYCPGMGRWASRDPIGERAGLLLYNICRNNGIGSVDTLGLATIRWPPPGEISSPPIGMILPPDVTFPSISPPLEDLIDPDLPQLPPINSETYAVKKCEIVIFYGHGWIEFFKGVSVDKCGGTTAVTCKSNVIFTYLAGLIPDAVGTDIDVDFGAPSPGKDFAGHLYRPNVAAMKMYAEKLKKPHCCCPDVKLKAKCLGTFMECNSGPWTIKTGWFAPPAGIP